MTISYDMPDLVYHQSTALSSTGARKLLPPSTPAHFHKWRNTIQPSSDAFDLGHVVHRLVLGAGAEFTVLDPAIHGLKKDGTVADSPAATSSWKAAVAEARASNTVPIHTDVYTEARQMADAVLNNPDAAALMEEGNPEVSMFGDDPHTGVPLRARFDWLNGDTAFDLKTAASAELGEFSRSASKYGYYVQEMFYRHVAECAGHQVNRFVFVTVEKSTCFVTVNEWDALAQMEGNRLVRQAIDTYYECNARNEWPAYPAGINLMSLPDWAISDEMEIA